MDKIETVAEDVKEDLTRIKRESESIDDFEHLSHEISPLKEKTREEIDDFVTGLKSVDPLPRDVQSLINTRVENPTTAVHNFTDPPLLSSEARGVSKSENLIEKPLQMDTNLLEMGDGFPDRKEADDKLDKFLQEMGSFAAPNKHQESPENLHKDVFDGFKTATQNFMDNEREIIQPKSSASELLERYSDSDPEDNVSGDDFKPSKYEDLIPKKMELPEISDKHDTFKDVKEFEPELPKKDYSAEIPRPSTLASDFDLSQFDPIQPLKPATAPPPVEEKVKEKTPEVVKEVIQEVVKTKVEELVKEKTPEPVKEKLEEPPKTTEIKKSPETKPKVAAIEAEAIFCKMGLDAWFNPERLNPKVESLIYWRDPKKSGPVFGGVLVVLLALTYFSLISVIAYLSLLALTGTISFRIYKNIVQAVQKTGDGHPFKDLLEFDISLPQEKVKEVSEVGVAHINAAAVELRRLFLVEDLVDSIKFGVLLWTLTYLGAWFNGMTLIIIAWVALFSLPKVYETNKTQIDANLDIVRTKVAEITSKVKAAIPIGKKTEEKKEQ